MVDSVFQTERRYRRRKRSRWSYGIVGGVDMEEEVSSRIVIEEWNGTASSKLSKTATITAHSSSLSIRTHGGRFNHLSRIILEAFVPEATNLLSLSLYISISYSYISNWWSRFFSYTSQCIVKGETAENLSLDYIFVHQREETGDESKNMLFIYILFSLCHFQICRVIQAV